MKRKIAILMSVVMSALSVGNVMAGDKDYATREYVISEFVQAVGRNTFMQKNYNLDRLSDGDQIDADYIADVKIALANNIVKGYDDNTIKPTGLITRAEAAVMLSRCLGSVEISQNEKNFTDVPAWAKEDVNKLTQGGILSGYDDTTFGASDNITIEQVQIIVDKIEERVNKFDLKNSYYDYFDDKFRRNNSLSEGETMYSYFDKVTNTVNSRIDGIIKDAQNRTDENYIKIDDMFNLFKDHTSKETLGISELQPYLDKIDSIKSVEEIPELESYLFKEINIAPLFNFSSSISPENSSKNIMTISESNVVLDRSRYFNYETIASQKAYKDYVQTVLNKCGYTNSKDMADKIYDFERVIIQKASATGYSTSAVVIDRADADKYVQNISLKAFLDDISSKGNRVYINNSEQLRQMSLMLTKDNLDTIKAYYKTIIITSFGGYLSDDITDAYYEMINSVYGGEIPDTATRAVNFVRSYAGSAITSEYAKLYYSQDIENNISEMVTEIKDYYREMISKNDWLSEETKAEAIKKLDNMKIKIGYNKNPLPYASKLVTTPKENGGTLMSNILGYQKVLSEYNINSIDGSVDKNRWSISPLMVNACYVPTGNEIIIPMGILESPFYDTNSDYFENLGSIGSIIAHEISHAFDPVGANYDENGDIRDWWTEKDKNMFYDLADKVIKYFSKYEVIEGIENNGQNTLIENVADISAMNCIVEIVHDKNGDIKKVMEANAKMWASIHTDEYAIRVAKTDTHSIPRIRINGVLSDTNDFYAAYGIGKDDGMYVSPENRVRIW